MQIGSAAFAFEWIEDFADIPDPEETRHGWAHHGMAMAGNGNLLAFHPSRSALLELTTDGGLVRSFDVPLTEGHGITICQGGAHESIWFADNGRKRQPDHDYQYVWGEKAGHVVRMSHSGDIEMELSAPDLPVYDGGTFSPTQVAVWQANLGGNDDIWVADGYGENLVHRFTVSGDHVLSIDGTEGTAGAFKTPHAIWFDSRKQDPELYVADRASQCEKLGELAAAIRAGIWNGSTPAELGAIVVKAKTGRTSDDQITVCDLTGTGAQDTAIATLARERALTAGAGTTIQS